MLDRRKETEFLRWLIGFGDPGQCGELRDRIHEVQRDEYMVRRATIGLGVLLLVSLAGLGYSVVFVPDWLGRYLPWMVRIFCALGLSAALSSVACLVCWWRQHAKLEALHEECRDLIRAILLNRLNGIVNIDSANYGTHTEIRKLPIAS